jgi:hypothetical protein
VDKARGADNLVKLDNKLGEILASKRYHDSDEDVCVFPLD